MSENMASFSTANYLPLPTHFYTDDAVLLQMRVSGVEYKTCLQKVHYARWNVCSSVLVNILPLIICCHFINTDSL